MVQMNNKIPNIFFHFIILYLITYSLSISQFSNNSINEKENKDNKDTKKELDNTGKNEKVKDDFKSFQGSPWDEQYKEYEELVKKEKSLEEEYDNLKKENQEQNIKIEKNKIYIYILLASIGVLIILLFIFICIKIYVTLNEKNTEKEEVLIERVNKIFATSLINNNINNQINDYGAPQMANYHIDNHPLVTNNPDNYNKEPVNYRLYKPYPNEQI